MKLAWTLKSTESAKYLLEHLIVLTVALAATYFSIFSKGFETTVQGAKLLDSKETLASVFGFSDSGSYLKAAIDLEATGSVRPDFFWIYNLWPPGMPFLEALLISLEPAIPFAISYSLTIWIIWSFLFWWLAWMLRKKTNLPLALAFITLATQLSPFTDWIFGHGFFYAEGISSLFFVFGLNFFIQKVVSQGASSLTLDNAIKSGIVVGMAFGMAAYFRASYSLVLQIGLILLVIAAGFLVWKFKNLEVKVRKEQLRLSLRRLAMPSIAIATMAVLMLPWQIFASTIVRPGNFSWSTVSSSFIAGTWVSRVGLANGPGSFLAEGGVGWACHLDPAECEKILDLTDPSRPTFDSSKVPNAAELGIRAVLVAIENPIDFASDRLYFLTKGWFSSETSMGIPAVANGFVNLILLFVFLHYLWPHLKGRKYELLVVPLLAVSQILPLIIGHVEPRYFIPIKLLILCLPAVFDVPVKQIRTAKTDVGDPPL